jgi:hypothetical protein
MLKFLGENYFIDIEKVNQLTIMKDVESGTTETNISIVKFELVKTLIDVVMTENEEIDENLGMKGTNNLSLPFKLAFNTLLTYGIIKTI